MEPRPVAHSLSVLVHWLGPTDLNSAGFVHGGVVMKLCDQVAGLAGVRHSGGRVVTAGMDRMTFNEPIHIGELLTLRASVNAVWRTSMEVGVRVEAERPGGRDGASHQHRLPDDGRRRRRGPAARSAAAAWSPARTRSGASGPLRRGAAID